jgi:pre-mRNA-processing factor 40
LQELVDSGKIVARTKWKEVYPLFKDDERYINMLGNPGSNQLELFWDVVDGLDQKLDEKIALVNDVIQANSPEGQVFIVVPETSEDDFFSTVKGYKDTRLEPFTNDELRQVFSTVNLLS